MLFLKLTSGVCMYVGMLSGWVFYFANFNLLSFVLFYTLVGGNVVFLERSWCDLFILKIGIQDFKGNCCKNSDKQSTRPKLVWIVRAVARRGIGHLVSWNLCDDWSREEGQWPLIADSTSWNPAWISRRFGLYIVCILFASNILRAFM